MGFRSRPVAFGQQTPLLSILSHTRISVEVRGSRPVALIWRPDGSTTLGLGERLPCDPGARVRGNRPRVQGEKVVAAGGSFAGPCLGLASRTSFKACCPGRRLAYSPFGTAPPAPDSRRGSTLRRSQRNQPPKSRVRGRLRSRLRHADRHGDRDRLTPGATVQQAPPYVEAGGKKILPRLAQGKGTAHGTWPWTVPAARFPFVRRDGGYPHVRPSMPRDLWQVAASRGWTQTPAQERRRPADPFSCSQSMLRQDINLSDVAFRLNPLWGKTGPKDSTNKYLDVNAPTRSTLAETGPPAGGNESARADGLLVDALSLRNWMTPKLSSADFRKSLSYPRQGRR